MANVFISLGSNIGDKIAHLKSAVERLAKIEGIYNLEKSSLYTTAPVGYLEQDDFVNAVVKLETTLTPEALLEVCQHIEQELKRERLIRWGPRTIDIDILCFDEIQSDDPVLTLPHPRMTERSFVLTPLSELAAALCISGKPVSEWLASLKDQEIRKMTNEKW